MDYDLTLPSLLHLNYGKVVLYPNCVMRDWSIFLVWGQANQHSFPKGFRIKLPVQVPDFENSNLRKEILSLQTEIGNRLRDLVLEHYKSLANTIESKIESTKKSMFNKAEASSLSIKDKQRLTKIIENKITPIENRASKLRNQLREKREKKASRNNVWIPNPQSPRHPNGKCGNKPAFPRKQAAHHRMRPYPPPQYHHIPTQRHAHTCHRKRTHPPPPQYHHIPTQSHMHTQPPPPPLMSLKLPPPP